MLRSNSASELNTFGLGYEQSPNQCMKLQAFGRWSAHESASLALFSLSARDKGLALSLSALDKRLALSLFARDKGLAFSFCSRQRISSFFSASKRLAVSFCEQKISRLFLRDKPLHLSWRVNPLGSSCLSWALLWQASTTSTVSQGTIHFVLASLRAHFVGYVKPTAGIFQWNRKKGGDSMYCTIYLFFAIRGVCGSYRRAVSWWLASLRYASTMDQFWTKSLLEGRLGHVLMRMRRNFQFSW